MKTANCMTAILRDAGVANNGHVVDEAFHCSKRRAAGQCRKQL
jgi:hypothetical protein